LFRAIWLQRYDKFLNVTSISKKTFCQYACCIVRVTPIEKSTESDVLAACLANHRSLFDMLSRAFSAAVSMKSGLILSILLAMS